MGWDGIGGRGDGMGLGGAGGRGALGGGLRGVGGRGAGGASLARLIAVAAVVVMWSWRSLVVLHYCALAFFFCTQEKRFPSPILFKTERA